MIISSRVPPAYAKFTVLEYLVSRFTYLTKEEWQIRISEGRIKRDETSLKEDDIIQANETIAYDMPDFVEPPADLHYKIVFEDEWLLGIDKPGNLLVHHKGRSFKSNLIYQLRYVHQPPYPTADIVNRLDRETSGIVVVAKDKETLSALNRLFAKGEVTKEYVAIVEGSLQPASGTIDKPIGKVSGGKISYRFGIDGEKPKSALTKYETLDQLQEYSLVRLFPKTGRTHQLRVHMHALGCTILGDKLYGMSDDDYIAWQQNPELFKDRLTFSRCALHCARVAFIHPITKSPCTIEASVPKDMQSFIDSFSRIE